MERVRVDRFPVGSVLLNELMERLMEEVRQQPLLKTKLYQVHASFQLPAFFGSNVNVMDMVLPATLTARVRACMAMQANFHTTLSGQAMVTLIYHKELGADWQEAARKLQPLLGACPSSSQPAVDIIGRSRKRKVELDKAYVIEKLNVAGRSLTYKQVGGSTILVPSRRCKG